MGFKKKITSTRYWIEKIRVNSRYDIFGYHPTQAEIIAVLFFVAGAIGYWWLRNSGKNKAIA